MFAPESFVLTGVEFDESTATIRLGYRFDDGPVLSENLSFPGAHLPLDEGRRTALGGAMQALHLAAGVSYYKAGVPPLVQREAGGLPPSVADFFEEFYRQGLGEFAWRNGLTLDDRPRFPRNSRRRWQPATTPLSDRVVVPMGGGKDSLLALEMVREAGVEPTLISVGRSELIAAVARRTGLPHIRIGRRLAPGLKTLNRRGAWNGHVPITGIIAFVLVCAAVLYDFDTVVMANERSASSATLVTESGAEVNHQWSKSLAFEAAFEDFIRRHVLEDFRYFSLLRPLSELAIARRFSRYSQYFDVFSSCNRNFRQDAVLGQGRWCGDCPKCRFVFLMLAPFVERHELVELFGVDLLDDPGQTAGYDALLGLADHKPFECVGETRESMAAFCLLARDPAWRGAALVRRFAEEALPRIEDPDRLVEEVLATAGEHRIPDRFRRVLHAA